MPITSKNENQKLKPGEQIILGLAAAVSATIFPRLGRHFFPDSDLWQTVIIGIGVYFGTLFGLRIYRMFRAAKEK